MRRENKGYALAAFLGAIGGVAIVGIAAKVIPKMMAGMMRSMMANMGENGCNPAQI
ncbi:hypothetical protein ACFL6S_13970 [Candidatus Poribacteria bacterium]